MFKVSARVQLVLFLAAMCAAFLMASPAGSAPTECNVWAYNEGEDGFPDSAVMKTIGCDDGPNVDGQYERAEGYCAYTARDAYRTKGFAADSVALDFYMWTKGCDTLEDGSYERLETNWA